MKNFYNNAHYAAWQELKGLCIKAGISIDPVLENWFILENTPCLELNEYKVHLIPKVEKLLSSYGLLNFFPFSMKMNLEGKAIQKAKFHGPNVGALCYLWFEVLGEECKLFSIPTEMNKDFCLRFSKSDGSAYDPNSIKVAKATFGKSDDYDFLREQLIKLLN